MNLNEIGLQRVCYQYHAQGCGEFYSLYIGIFGLDKVYSSLSAGLRHSLDHLEHKKMFM